MAHVTYSTEKVIPIRNDAAVAFEFEIVVTEPNSSFVLYPQKGNEAYHSLLPYFIYLSTSLCIYLCTYLSVVFVSYAYYLKGYYQRMDLRTFVLSSYQQDMQQSIYNCKYVYLSLGLFPSQQPYLGQQSRNQPGM